MTKRIEDLSAGIVLLLLSIIIYVSSNSIERLVVTSIGPDFMPKLVAIGMGIFSCLLILKNVRVPHKQTQDAEAEEGASSIDKPDRRFKQIIQKHIDLITICLLLIYAAGIAVIGFLIATSIYLFCQISLMRMNKKSNIPLVAAVSIGISVIVYMLFTKVLYVMLPQGPLG